MSPPSTDLLQSSTEKLASFVTWIAELIQKRNWFTLLLLIDVAWFFFANPGVAGQIYQTFTGGELPEQYSGFFWLVLGLFFIAALGVAVATMPRPLQLDVSEGAARKAIKGLRSFGVEDAEIFSRLQRNESLKDCLESISRDDFRFGILIGESGCGKTSFLQAGLLPRLSQPDATLRGVYVKFSDRPPIETVAAALIDCLKLPKSTLNEPNFLTVLTAAVETAQKPVVLLFDQFEQFFVHQPRMSDRQPFIDALTEWYCHPDPPPIKILVSIRADLMHELHSVQQALGYTLSRYQIFKLEKFDPAEATEILRVFAEIEELSFERRFVEELTQTELTTTEGKVSPVDLQICAELVRKQKLAEQRAFSREAFQKLGGIEGLLNRYLEETLEDLRLQGHLRLYQTALQVMLMLTDRERNVRAGVLAIATIQEMLQGIATPAEVNTAVNWLCSGEVRLITPVERNAVIGYELAHERIILPLLRLAGKELKEVDRANQMLERRVNEWVGNNRDRRYLLTLQELWLLRRHKTQLTWGANRRAKEQLIRQSQKRLYQFIWAAIAIAVLLFVGWIGWLTSPVQQWYAYEDLARRSVMIDHGTRSLAATAFAKNGDWNQAKRLVTSMQSDPGGMAQALASIAEVATTLNQPERAAIYLDEALNVVDEIQDDSTKPNVLGAIAQAYGSLNDVTIAEDGLEQLRGIADQIEGERERSVALSAIAQGYVELNDTIAAQTLLKQALISIEKIEADSSDLTVLGVIARVYGDMDDTAVVEEGLETLLSRSEQIQDDYAQSSVLIAIARAYTKLDNSITAKGLLEQALISAEKIEDSSNRFYMMSQIVEAYGELDDVATTRVGLEQLTTSAEEFSEKYYEVSLLGAIAQGYADLDDVTISKSGLEQLHEIAEKFRGEYYEADLLTELAQAYSQLDDIAIAKQGLEQIRISTEKLEGNSRKPNVFSAIASAYIKLKEYEIAMTFLDQSIAIAEKVQDPYLKSGAFENIVRVQCQLAEAYHKAVEEEARAILDQAYTSTRHHQISYSGSMALQEIVVMRVKLDDWRQVNQTVNRCTSENCRVSVLIKALTTHAELQRPELIKPEEE